MKIKALESTLILTVFAVLSIFPLTSRAESCTTAECHTEFKQMKSIHAPADGNCVLCHDKIGKHKFKLVEQRELCYDCHDENRKGKYVHEAVTSLECSGCHNSHGGDFKFYLKSQRIDTMCFDCHDKDPMTREVLHQPLAEGDCTACHKPHASDYRSLLISEKKTFCVKCHEDKAFLLKKGKDQKLKIHSIVEEGCTECHNPHSHDYKYMLEDEPGEICAGCHEDIGEKAMNAKFKHAALEKEQKCLTCHEAHAAPFAFNLKKNRTDLCTDCHNKWIKGSDGKQFNIYRMVRELPVKHKPVEDENCHKCHDPHGSDFYKILKANFPDRFYTKFSEENYKLCFDCHDSKMVTLETTTRATNFRDGSRNLHHLHVKREKSRTCRICHNAHASKTEKLLNETTPFSKWSLPIGFKRTSTGGTCLSGCHKLEAYNR